MLPNTMTDEMDEYAADEGVLNGMQDEIDEQYFPETIAGVSSFLTDWNAENERYIVGLDENSFVETISQFYILNEKTTRFIGTLCWKRLRSYLRFEDARDSKERRSKINQWAAQMSLKANDKIDYFRLDKWVNDAMARELEPRVEGMSVTAGSEIVRDAGETEDEVREKVAERVENAQELDPLNERPTQAVRETKQMEKTGNHAPSVIRTKIVSPEPVYREFTFLGQVVTGRETDETTGEIKQVMEYVPVLSVYLEMPQSEELRPQIAQYQKILLQRMGGKVRDMEQEERE